MLFNSDIYIFLFLPVTVAVYFILNHFRFQGAAKFFLGAASLFFYSWWNWRYLPLIVMSVVFNYFTGRTISPRLSHLNINQRKWILIFGVTTNLGVLAFFKYADFFIANANLITGTGMKLMAMALPLAISFFTFQQVAYLVDSYRGETKEYSFINYSIFVTFFPQLIAGPIVHHKEMMGQFISRKSKILNWENMYVGLFIFSIGLFKKVFIADTFAVWATAGFDQAVSLHFIEAWVTSLSYTLQIYYDFSGYTDMAIGSAWFFNIRLPQNFNSPYKALNIQDFWRRWHMTLSRWLRDYLFIPLGGNRCSTFKTVRNLMITFLLGGLWHGAGWTFVIWGAMHGCASVIHRLWSDAGLKMPKVAAWLVTFLFVNVTWIFFRALDFKSAVKVLRGMVDFKSLYASLAKTGNFPGIAHLIPRGDFLDVLPWFGVFMFIAFMVRNSNQLIENLKPSYLWAAISLILLLMGMPDFQQPSEFLYFNF